MSPFDSQKVFEFTKLLSFPRLVGTTGERKAAALIVRAFQDIGLDVDEERFHIAILPWTIVRLSLLVSLVAILIARLSGPNNPTLSAAVLLAGVVGTFLAGRLWQAILSSSIGSKRNGGLESSNIVARFGSESAGEIGDKPIVCLSSHYDTKSQSISLPARIALALILSGSLTFLFTMFLLRAVGYTRFELTVFRFAPIIDIPILIAVGAITVLFLVRTHNKSPGALDNATGIGLMLGVADVFKDKPPANLDLRFVVFGAEEQGLIGSSQFLLRHRHELSQDHFHLLNFDGVGAAGKLRACYGSRLSFRFPDGRLAKAVRKAADQTGIGLGLLPLLPGLLMDHVPFAAAGFETLSLASLASESGRIHTSRDTIELVDMQRLREVGDLTLRTIGLLDQAAGAPNRL